MVAQIETSTLNSDRRLLPTVEGLVQVFTSSHRSFFTNVMAQALRIAGQGTSVLVVQFLKGGIDQGYDRPVQLGQNLDWIRCNLPRCIDTPHLDDAEMEALHQLWQNTKKAIFEAKYNLFVLDELSLAVKFGLIPENEVLEVIKRRPSHVDIILTGPEISETILDMADQVTEIRRSNRV